MRKLIVLFICFGLIISSLAISGCQQKATEQIKPAEVTKPATEKFVKPADAKPARIMLDINEEGIIVKAKQLGPNKEERDLEYAAGVTKKMDDLNDVIMSLNPCRWVYTQYGWQCL